MAKFDFSGWATRNNLRCSDGRTIMKDAFKQDSGRTVPLVWNHQHNDPLNILGHALLENREEGVYAYCKFNDTEAGRNAKLLVEHGDVSALSIFANQLKQQAGNVMHGVIREVSLVLAGANPGAFIDSVMCHGDSSDEEAVIYTGENISLCHSEDGDLEESKEDKEMAEETKKDKTVAEVVESMTEEQKTVMYALIGQALEENETDDEEKVEHSEGGDYIMKHNIFDQNEMVAGNTLSHADQTAILEMAKSSAIGSLKTAMAIYAEENSLAHGWEDITELFPDYKDVRPGAPELLERDQSWVGLVMKKVHKSPISRIRTRQADARANALRAKGYTDRKVAKTLSGDLKLIMRTTDPQTVYRRDELHRDDIVDITDFDVVNYQKTVMKHNLEEDVALAILIGDGREDTDQDKIHENHIRSIWNDEDMYTIHQDVNIEAAKAELQGTDTAARFGDNYIRAEAMVTAALYAREKYKGKGQLDLFIDPHELNVMLLARDLNGRRIYDSKEDLAKALNVGEIHTVEQFAGRTRTTSDNKVKKLLGLFVNLGNYQIGCTKGGEITNFEDFDIDFNKYKYLMETRLSGALTDLYSAIALEEDVTA